MSIRISALLGLSLVLPIAGCQCVERSLESKPRGQETTLSPAEETTAATPVPSLEGTGPGREPPGTRAEAQAETGEAGSAKGAGTGTGETGPEAGPTGAEAGGETAATMEPGALPTSLPVEVSAPVKDELAESTPAVDASTPSS